MASLQQHFVLVHGAGHGAWCWFKLRHLLQDAGHKVSCFDLTGAGINLTDPNTIVSFHDYNQPLSHFMSCLPPNHKVVLVGHSAGGLSLTQALHEFADKISVVIFLAATMLPFGFLTEEDMNDVVEDLSGYGDVFQMYYGMGPNNPPTSLKLKEEFQRELFYHMSPTEVGIAMTEFPTFQRSFNQVMILSHDREGGRVSLSTKKLEPTPGDMIHNPNLVFEKA
ncbi:hypothetical protein J5N97_025864 [Dioscorea zingiberensis]|uniref:AB hydrolase-1 domain-containing protein n=1 Tax=Dioscorea zingiberensis TaxID=325984 RepID=A0A9D5H667_9LILI|nr:hypothetical protein J5N97_025864 [Dioscorea zingiberensis]